MHRPGHTVFLYYKSIDNRDTNRSSHVAKPGRWEVDLPANAAVVHPLQCMGRLLAIVYC
jgi:hypothetical protein